MDGVTTTVKVAHVRLCHSRMMFVRACPRETQEMAFDAHERAFAFFRGAACPLRPVAVSVQRARSPVHVVAHGVEDMGADAVDPA